MEERIHKLLAQAGVASRRKAEQLIADGLVTINGQKAEIGAKADPTQDDIRVEGRRIRFDERPRYLILNKKRGIVSTTDDPEGRTTILQGLEMYFSERLYPVGRLDMDSEGLVLLTNDGDLAHRLTHPRYGCQKTYKVLLEGQPSEEKLERWRAGILLEGENTPTQPCHVRMLESTGYQTWVRVVMSEGKKRQIRRIAEALGHPVKRLIRTHIGAVALDNLKPGHFRELSPLEVDLLKNPDERPKRAPVKSRPLRTGELAPKRRTNQRGGSRSGSVKTRRTGRPPRRPSSPKKRP
jgi:pseudouridine synthase